MDKSPTSVMRVDPDNVARIEKRAGEENVDHVDPSVIADLEAQWAEVEASGELIPHEEVRRWLKTWGTPAFKPWSASR